MLVLGVRLEASQHPTHTDQHTQHTAHAHAHTDQQQQGLLLLAAATLTLLLPNPRINQVPHSTNLLNSTRLCVTAVFNKFAQPYALLHFPGDLSLLYNSVLFNGNTTTVY